MSAEAKREHSSVERGREGPQAGGDGTKKVTLCLVSCVIEKGEHVDK